MFFSDVIRVDFISFSEQIGVGQDIGERGLFSSNIYDNWTEFELKISYNKKDYYSIGIGGVGSSITHEITEKEIIIRDKYHPNEYAMLNLLSDGSIKVISKTEDFYGNWRIQAGWIYSPVQPFF